MSLLRETYYHLKPFLPVQVRLGLRRIIAARKLAQCRDVWPINPVTAKRPSGWPCWPDGKKFALILTHDVEAQTGVDKCEELSDLERSMGFRSSFNFVPEGCYQTSRSLRDKLTKNGFEIGVHDLHHNGKLYTSKKEFIASATKINSYLKDWGAVGFRSGFMHHNLEWLHKLEIRYDMSTFDTDPFEPQPDPHPTIFPFWVQDGTGQNRYLEFPYTLPQDSTLFLVLREKTIATWKTKLDWIVQHGGMALLNTHPDYMCFDGTGGGTTYPAALYKEFLAYVQTNYKGDYWPCVPRELADFMHERASTLTPTSSAPRKKIWIDLDNTPHVPFFKPIIHELEARGHNVAVTSRRAFQVCELATESGLKHTSIGRHYGKNPVAKIVGLFIRAFQFVPFVIRERPDLAVSHGARSQILICNLLGIKTVLLADYEHARILPFLRPTWLLVPEVIPTEGLTKCAAHVAQYPGIKEDVYVPRFRPTSNGVKDLGLDGAKLLVTVRPPANEAHYRSPESDLLFDATMEHLTSRGDVQIVLLPRNQNQLASIRELHPQWFSNQKTVVPSRAIDGLNLLWHSDAVVSGGGTMNREAAALGIPVYSIFRGKTGAVDRHLEQEKRLLLLHSPGEVREKIIIKLRQKDETIIHSNTNSKSLDFIVNCLEGILNPKES